MNIHEYQAKNILKEFGVPVPNGIVILNKNEIENKAKKLNSKNLAIKAQIHAGGRGKAGGIKLVNNYKDLIEESNKLFDKILVTKQTGKQGKKVKRIYLEEISNIIKIKKDKIKVIYLGIDKKYLSSECSKNFAHNYVI